MKKLSLMLVLVLTLAGMSFGAKKAHRGKTFTGEIMDSMCAEMGSHEQMMKKEGAKDAKECTEGCVKAGGKYVLYDAATKTIYQLDNQDKPKDFAGQKVKVSGTYNKKTKTIHVENIEAAS